MIEAFINKSAEILGETDYKKGLTNSEIKKYFSNYGNDYNKNPECLQADCKYQDNNLNKKDKIKKNLQVFTNEEKFSILNELFSLDKFSSNSEAIKQKIKLFQEYQQYNKTPKKLDIKIVEEIKHFLKDYPESLKSFQDATIKIEANIFNRNALDDLRFSLEQFLKELLDNDKSLENQLKGNIETFIKTNGYSKYISTMFQKLVDSYASHQNETVKHKDQIKQEIEFIFDLTIAFMKFLIKVKNGYS
jgi:hypothetical protein